MTALEIPNYRGPRNPLPPINLEDLKSPLARLIAQTPQLDSYLNVFDRNALCLTDRSCLQAIAQHPRWRKKINTMLQVNAPDVLAKTPSHLRDRDLYFCVRSHRVPEMASALFDQRTSDVMTYYGRTFTHPDTTVGFPLEAEPVRHTWLQRFRLAWTEAAPWVRPRHVRYVAWMGLGSLVLFLITFLLGREPRRD